MSASSAKPFSVSPLSNTGMPRKGARPVYGHKRKNSLAKSVCLLRGCFLLKTDSCFASVLLTRFYLNWKHSGAAGNDIIQLGLAPTALPMPIKQLRVGVVRPGVDELQTAKDLCHCPFVDQMFLGLQHDLCQIQTKDALRNADIKRQWRGQSLDWGICGGTWDYVI